MSDKLNLDSEIKARIQVELSSGTSVEETAEKFNIDVESVAMIASNLSTPGTDKAENISLGSYNSRFVHAVEAGVMDDNLNYRRLIGWSVLGLFLVVAAVIGVYNFEQFSRIKNAEQVSINSEYELINRLNSSATETLNSFGVVNLEEGVYRIPIDSAISRMTTK